MWKILVQDAAGTWQVVDTAGSQAEAEAKRQLYLLRGKHAAIRDDSNVTNDTGVYSSGSPTIDAVAKAQAEVDARKARVIEWQKVYNDATGQNVSIDKPVNTNKPMIATIITFIVIIAIAAAYKS